LGVSSWWGKLHGVAENLQQALPLGRLVGDAAKPPDDSLFGPLFSANLTTDQREEHHQALLPSSAHYGMDASRNNVVRAHENGRWNPRTASQESQLIRHDPAQAGRDFATIEELRTSSTRWLPASATERVAAVQAEEDLTPSAAAAHPQNLHRDRWRSHATGGFPDQEYLLQRARSQLIENVCASTSYDDAMRRFWVAPRS